MARKRANVAKGRALITGASSGIGLELARLCAKRGYDIVIVARSEDKLAELARELRAEDGVEVTVLAADLSRHEAPAEIVEALSTKGIDVELLVNNAGFATYGPSHEQPVDKQLSMIQVNVAALTELTHRLLPAMVQRGSGGVLNVASTAAFLPGPGMAGYHATKAFVLHFSEAVAMELEGTGVTITALCPGPTESGFQSRAEMENARLVQSGLMSARKVAEVGLAAVEKGKAVAVPGFSNRMIALAPRFFPRAFTARLVKRFLSPVGT